MTRNEKLHAAPRYQRGVLLAEEAFMSTRVIGLGNTILTDDGVGVYVAREVACRLAKQPYSMGAAVVESEVGGFALVELMAGWEQVILVDSIQLDGLRPGTVVRLAPTDLRTSLRIRSIHEIDLPTALELGHRLGLDMPREVKIFGIQAGDACTFGEFLTPQVQAGMEHAVDLVLKELVPAPNGSVEKQKSNLGSGSGIGPA